MRHLLLIGALLALPGCVINVPTGSEPTGTANVTQGKVLTGKVIAPSSVIAAGGANAIAAGGANAIAAGGANWRVLAVSEAALTGSEVYLADAAGNRVPSVAPVTTDDQGRYTFANVPAGHTFVVACKAKTKDGKDATLQTLAKSSELGTAATTMVTAAVVSGQGGSLANFNPVSFQTAAEATSRNLTDANLPDFSSRTAILAKMDELAQSIGEIKTALGEIKQELAEIKSSLKDVHGKLDQLLAKPGAGAQPAPGGTSSGGDSGAEGGASCDDTFRFLDGDADAVVTVQEWAAKIPGDPASGTTTESMFYALDMNYDGVLARAEWLGLCGQYDGAANDEDEAGSNDEGSNDEGSDDAPADWDDASDDAF